MTRNVSITFREREIHNPVLRKLAAAVLVVGAAVVIPVGMAWLAFTVATTLPLHLAIRASGRRGFMSPGPDMNYEVPIWAMLLVSVPIAGLPAYGLSH